MKLTFLILATAALASIASLSYAEGSGMKKVITSAVIDLKSPHVILSVPINRASGMIDPDNDIYFDGVKECAAGNPTSMAGLNLSHVGKCLFFHTQFSADRWSQVPIEKLPLVNDLTIKDDLKKIYLGTGINVEANKTEKYDWGEVFYWGTQTSGSAHYMYLNYHKKYFSIRIGPIAGSVLSCYTFDFKSAKWKFD